jgi:beta-phosphoglucomutase-like phosphatase (HAD superfamily)
VKTVALVLEIEALLFDTHDVRTDALHRALAAEGIQIARHEVSAAHDGVTAEMALAQLGAAATGDDVVRQLVLRRTQDGVREELTRGMPLFDANAAAALARVATDVPLGVVTRAEREYALRMLEAAGLDVYVRTVLSLDARADDEQHHVWAEAAARLRATHVIAVAPARLLAGARAAGLTTVAVGECSGTTNAPLVSLAQLDTSFLFSLV